MRRTYYSPDHEQSYFELEAKADNILKPVEYDWMFDNIDDMANTAQKKVQTLLPNQLRPDHQLPHPLH